MKQRVDIKKIASYKNGNNCVIGAMYQLHSAMLAMVAYRYLQNTDDAKDAVMDVFEKLIGMEAEKRKLQVPDCPDHFAHWLIKMTKNVTLDIIKHRQMVDRYQSETITAVPHNYSDVERKWDKQTIDYVIAQLLESEQNVANLHYAGFSNDEIANKLNISYNTVRNQLSTAKKKIKKYISTPLVVLLLNLTTYVSI